MAVPTKPISKSDTRSIVQPESASLPEAERKPDAKAEPKAETSPRSEPKAEAKPAVEAKPAETKAIAKPPEAKAETPAAAPSPAEAWEVQLGAYAEPGRVRNILAKLKELGVPTFTEQVQTPNGQRTRVRAGPFPTQEAAEKAKARVKIIGVDGPVAKKP
jgi:DedD protein